MKSFKQFLFEASKAQLTAMKNHFKSTEGLTDDQLNYYVEYWDNIISKLPDGTITLLNDTLDPKEVKNIQNFISSKKNPQPKLSFKDLEQLVDAHKGRQEYTGREKEQSSSSGEEDIIYNKNNLIIKKGHSRQSCITHGKGHTWCISRPNSANLYNSYRFDPREKEPSFYFVYDKDKSKKDKWFHAVIYVRNDGTYKVALADNPGDKQMTWDEIIKHQPKLKGLEKLFKHIPLTFEEKELYRKFKNPISDEEFLKLNLKEMDFYISLGHELSEDVMLKLLENRATKAILNKYVITQWIVPKSVHDKLTSGQKKKIEENQIAAVEKEDWGEIIYIIDAGIEPSDNVISAAIDGGWYYPPKNIYDKLSSKLKEKVNENQLVAVETSWNAIYNITKARVEPSEAVQLAAVEKEDWGEIIYIIDAGFTPPESVQIAAVKDDVMALQYIIKAGIKLSEKVQLVELEKHGVGFIYDIDNVYDSVIKFILDNYDQEKVSKILSQKFKSHETKQKLQAAFDEKYGK